MAVLPRPSLIRNPINTKLASSFAMIPAARDSLCGLWEDGRELNGAEAAGGRSGYPGLILRHLERERGGPKKGPNAHPIDGVGPSKFQKRGGINQGKAPSKGCAYKLAPQRHLVF